MIKELIQKLFQFNFLRSILVASLSVLLLAISFPTLNRLCYGAWLDSAYGPITKPVDSSTGVAIAHTINVRSAEGPVDLVAEPLFVLLPLFIVSIGSFLRIPLNIAKQKVLGQCILSAIIYLPVASMFSMCFESPTSHTAMGSGPFFLVYLCNPISFAVIVLLLVLAALLILFLRKRTDGPAPAASELELK